MIFTFALDLDGPYPDLAFAFDFDRFSNFRVAPATTTRWMDLEAKVVLIFSGDRRAEEKDSLVEKQ